MCVYVVVRALRKFFVASGRFLSAPVGTRHELLSLGAAGSRELEEGRMSECGRGTGATYVCVRPALHAHTAVKRPSAPRIFQVYPTTTPTSHKSSLSWFTPIYPRRHARECVCTLGAFFLIPLPHPPSRESSFALLWELDVCRHIVRLTEPPIPLSLSRSVEFSRRCDWHSYS